MRTPNIADITTTPSVVYTSTGTLHQPVMLLIQNLGAAEVFIGGADVSSTTGLKIPVNSTFPLDLSSSNKVWAVTAAGTADVRIAIAGE